MLPPNGPALMKVSGANPLSEVLKSNHCSTADESFPCHEKAPTTDEPEQLCVMDIEIAAACADKGIKKNVARTEAIKIVRLTSDMSSLLPFGCERLYGRVITVKGF
jgi:hypothetical protein